MSYEQLRQRHFAEAMAALPAHVARLDWSAEQIRSERDARLRALLGRARDQSPWHRARLSDLDHDRGRGLDPTESLSTLPPMTKVDLLTHFDDIVTDDRLSLHLVEDHLDRLTSDAYLLDEHHAIASGGSSGLRGVYVYDWAGWATYFLSAARGQAYDRLHDPRLAAAPGSPRATAGRWEPTAPITSVGMSASWERTRSVSPASRC